METLIVSLTLNGIVLGLVYAAVALGFSLVIGVSGVINFSHGIVFAFGGFLYWFLNVKIGFWPSVVCIPVIVGAIGLLIERGLIRRIYGHDPLFGLLITLGFAIAMEELLRIIFGAQAYTMNPPAFLQGSLIAGDFVFSWFRLFTAAFAAVILGGVWLLIERTRYGAIVKAGMFNADMVGALGHNLPFMRTSVFIIGAALAGLSGILYAPLYGLKSGMGTDILMPSFIIVLMGGLGSIPGTILAGLIIGVSSSLGTLVIPRFVDIIPYMLLGIVIFWRPRGFFGEQSIIE